MRVLIDQQFHPGHHYQYVAQLLPAVCGLADDVVVAVTPAGRASVEFEAFLKPFSDRVRFEPILPEGNPGFPLHDRLPMHRALRDAVKRLDPDYVLIPSGDAQATAMALFRWTGRGALPKSIPCEVGIHFGAGRDASLKVQLRDVINGWNLGLSGCRKVHLVNHLFFERLRRIPVVGRTFSAVPHPVARPPAVGTLESRRRLGLPEHGRYIGLAGSLDSRKALAEFIAAFRDATSEKTDRLLLAGWMNDTHAEMIRRSHTDLLGEERLLLRTGFLDQPTYHAALTALDVVCTPYPGFGGLSSTLLEGLAARRPILANAYGWSRAIVEQFNVGWTCDVLNHQQFTTAIRTALNKSHEYAETESVRRLLTFHSAENFAATWVEGLRAAQGLVSARPCTWDWVVESTPDSPRVFH